MRNEVPEWLVELDGGGGVDDCGDVGGDEQLLVRLGDAQVRFQHVARNGHHLAPTLLRPLLRLHSVEQLQQPKHMPLTFH